MRIIRIRLPCRNNNELPIKPILKKANAMKYIISSLLILLATTASAEDSPVERIAPYLTETAVAVARVDLKSLDIDPVVKQFQPFLRAVASEDKPYGQLIARMKSLREAGIEEIFIVYDLAESPGDFVYTVMSISEGVEPPDVGEGRYEMRIEDTIISGSSETIDYFKNKPTPGERPGLASAFEAVAGAPVQVVVAPTADQRRILREMLPDLSGDDETISGGELSAGLKWAAFGLEFEPKFAAPVTIQSDTEETAQALRQAIALTLREISDDERLLEVLPTAPTLVDSLIPERRGDQLVIRPEQAVKVVSQVFASLVKAATHDARRRETKNRMKQFGLAMHNFHGDYGGFPPSASYSADGKPLLSWRVFLLPYLEESDLYEQFHLDEPWDSEHNKALIEKMPEVLKSPLTPTEPGMTVFQVATGEGLVFDGETGKGISDITDGTSNTILVVETTAEAAVPWTKPDDLEVDPKNPKAGLVEGRDGFWTTFCDGSARMIPSNLDPETLMRLFMAADGEVIGEF